jgi:hypothetical protein
MKLVENRSSGVLMLFATGNHDFKKKEGIKIIELNFMMYYTVSFVIKSQICLQFFP